jgi:hypothetical protein
METSQIILETEGLMRGREQGEKVETYLKWSWSHLRQVESKGQALLGALSVSQIKLR